MKLFDLIGGGTIKEAGNAINGIVDNIVTNDEERLELKKQLMEVTAKLATDLTTQQSDVIKTEMGGTKLQRNWRPIVMLSFAGIVVYEYFVSSLFSLPKSGLPEKFWDLLEIGMGGYIIGRSVEKITGSIAEKWLLIPTKKNQQK